MSVLTRFPRISAVTFRSIASILLALPNSVDTFHCQHGRTSPVAGGFHLCENLRMPSSFKPSQDVACVGTLVTSIVCHEIMPFTRARTSVISGDIRHVQVRPLCRAPIPRGAQHRQMCRNRTASLKSTTVTGSKRKKSGSPPRHYSEKMHVMYLCWGSTYARAHVQSSSNIRECETSRRAVYRRIRAGYPWIYSTFSISSCRTRRRAAAVRPHTVTRSE